MRRFLKRRFISLLGKLFQRNTLSQLNCSFFSKITKLKMTTTLTKMEQLWRGKREIQVGDWGISYIGRLPVRLGKAQHIMANNKKNYWQLRVSTHTFVYFYICFTRIFLMKVMLFSSHTAKENLYFPAFWDSSHMMSVRRGKGSFIL